MFANNIVRALLSICSQVATGQVVTGQTLVSRDSGVFENHQRQTWKSTHVNLVGHQTRRRSDRIVVSELDAREPQIPVVLSFVTTIASIWAIVWFTCSTPPLPLG